MQSEEDKKLYLENNVELPESIQHEIKESKVPLSAHVWKQSGNMIYCESCGVRHAQYIPTNLLLHGTEPTGKPILKKIKV